MSDQLSLELDAGLPHLPARLRPMLPRPAPEPFDSPEHLFGPSWGGRRALAFLEPAVEPDGSGRFRTADGEPSVRLIDAGGRDLAAGLPELAGLTMRLDARSGVLDGELVVVDAGGRADGPGLEARLDGRPGPPVAFLVFDLLYLDGRPLLGRPLVRRRETLARVLRPGPEVVAVPSIAGEGRALHDAVTAQGLAGVLARQRTSPYLPGVRSRLWRFVGAGSAGVRPAAERTEQGAGGRGAAGTSAAGGFPDARPSNAAAPVLALISRLPLDEEADPTA